MIFCEPERRFQATFAKFSNREISKSINPMNTKTTTNYNEMTIQDGGDHHYAFLHNK